MQLVVLDAETYYGDDFTLSKMTTESYVRDPRFEVIGVGVTFPETGQRAWMEEAQFRRFAVQYDWSQAAVLCHHAHFDGLILSHHYGVRPGYWLDTLSMGRAIHGAVVGNSLAALMLRYGVGEKGTEVINAKGKHRVDFTPEEWRRYGAYCLNDCDGTLDVFRLMAPGYPHDELDLIDITVRMFTEPALVLDEPVMREYLEYETQRKEDLLTRIGADKKTLSSGDKFATLLREYGVEPPTKLNPKGKPIYAFAKTDPGMQDLLEDESEDVRWLCEARVAVKSTGNQTRTQRMLNMGAGGRALPVYLKYAGAHTLRWSGADGVNWQNFERTNKKNPRKGMIRKSVRAPEGWLLVGGDASQIEARFNAWFSDEAWLIEAFRQGQDVYSLFGSEIYRRPIDRKNNPDDELPGHVSKTAVLGLGYQMAWLRFGAEVLKGANGAPPIKFTRDDLNALGIDPRPFLANPKNVERIEATPSRLPMSERLIHFTVAHYVVDIYRKKNARIAANWKFMAKVIDLMAQGYRGHLGKNGLIELVENGIRLPSGMVMHYHGLRKNDANEYVYLAKRGQIAKLHGGVLTENCIAAGTFVLTSAGWKPIEQVSIQDRIHDGVEFVSHGGLLHKQRQACVIVEGVHMTPNHEVLTDEGWAPALEKPRPYRPNIRGVVGLVCLAQRREENDVGVSLPLWGTGYASWKRDEAGGTPRADSELRLLDKTNAARTPHDARHEPAPCFCRLAEYERPVQAKVTPSVEKLRRPWYHGVCEVADFFREFLGRHGRRIRTGVNVGQKEQYERLLPDELSLGELLYPSEQQAGEQDHRHPVGAHDRVSGGGQSGHWGHYGPISPGCWVGFNRCGNCKTEPDEQEVYDILNCGPRNRFVVLGTRGPFIVHNCTQAATRIIVADAMRRLHKDGLKIVSSEHDAVIGCCPAVDAPYWSQRLLQEIATPPSWAPDIPLAAEGGFGVTLAETK